MQTPNERPSEERFSTKYSLWKDRLLDLTAKNRSLNFRPAKVASVQITLPKPTALLAALVDNERPLRFPLYKGKRNEDGQQREFVAPGEIETTRSASDLERSLHRLTALAKLFREERGINTLYLSVGMLNWQPADGAPPQKAPLMLVPVDVKREDRLKPYYLHPFDEDAALNPTLIYMLRRDFQFALPEIKEDWTSSDFEEFLVRVEHSVRSRGWTVERTTWLAQFNFKKLAMYRDLEQHGSEAKSSPLLGAIAGVRSPGPRVEILPEERFDDLSPRDVFTAFDADSSQLNALLRASKGQDLVIEGPPGTGKSQTIANLISQFLLEGKNVLFVSEKMAALDVVYARLRATGLATFCLELHSDKASRRDVLARIKKAAYADAVKEEDASRDVANLQQLRQQLNEYVRALHRPDAYGRTAFRLHGELAALTDVADVSADFTFDARRMTVDDEERMVRLLNRLTHLATLYRSDKEHPWRGCIVSEWSPEVSARMKGELYELKTTLASMQELARDLARALAIDAPRTVREARRMLDTARAVVESPLPPRHWLENQQYEALLHEVDVHTARQQRLRELTGRIDRSYRLDAHELDTESLLPSLSPSSLRFFDKSTALPSKCPACAHPLTGGDQRSARCGYCGESLDTGNPSARVAFASVAPQLRDHLRVHEATAASLLNHVRALSMALDETAPWAAEDMVSLADEADLLRRIAGPSDAWFDPGQAGRLVALAEECREKASRAKSLRETLGTQFSDRIYVLPVEDMRQALVARYRSPFRVCFPKYHRLMSRLRACSGGRSRLTYPAAIEALEQAVELIGLEGWFETRAEELKRLFGKHYQSGDTNWQLVVTLVRAADEAHKRGNGILTRPSVRGHLSAADYDYGGSADRMRALVGQFVREEHELRTLASGWSGEASVAATLDGVLSFQRDLERYVAAYDAVAAHRRSEADPDVLVSELALIGEHQQIRAAMDRESTVCGAQFGRLYEGAETDWNRVRHAIEWCQRLLSIHPAPGEIRDVVCDSTRVDVVRGQYEAYSQRLSTAAGAVTRIEGRFAPGTFVPALVDRDFEELSSWSDHLSANVGALDDWIEYRSIMRDVEKYGMSRFLHAARASDLAIESLGDAFRKRVRVLQLDEIYGSNPQLARFRNSSHSAAIAQFRELDRNLQKAHRRRIVATVASRRPQLGHVAAGQVQFLRRELAKQRRHAPLRKLFELAGNVVLQITPCLLMSPLSVATYLPKEAARFDVVIFDEASQMPPEEAIGPILRAKQIIVAGDPKQMPPSRFFEKSDVDDDDDDEEQSKQSLESILEDCQAAGFESRRLEWHYRSRHESLIAFSNAEFYENGLVTFPSAAEEDGRLGVRFVFKPNGVYDRGKSKTNRIEAREVAALVAAHYDGPSSRRSLGVIALSTAQAGAIEEEVERLRIERPDLDARMKSDVTEPFFIKALENVQGDERDDVIISVGYGKDSDGKFALNLGPVSLDGGERRLNVAFTRARFRVSLVSSVRGADIDVSHAKRSGPGTLKRYLEFAETGRLPAESGDILGETESPFEEAVKRALQHAGLDVVSQVGVSRYRIDLGIRDPRAPGRYLLGVECDGAMYHSSHVARDRDRLRQEALEDRGWRIFRIWSTEWIRDPNGVLSRLMQRVRELESEPLTLFDMGEVKSRSIDEPQPIETAESSDNMMSRIDSPLAMEYAETALGNLKRESFESDAPRIRQCVLAVVEREGPVHEEVVITRIARAYQMQRTGSRVEEMIRRQITLAIRQSALRKAGSFLWPIRGLEVQPRRPRDGATPRPIEHIAPEEIAAAIKLIVKHSGGIEPENLPREVARLFGFLRTGHRVEATISSVLKKMVSKGELVLNGVFLTIR